MVTLEMVLSVISGLCVCIPLVIQLMSAVYKHAKEKNWSALMSYLLDYMAEAESLFEKGADRKVWVMEMIEETADMLNYPYDDEARLKVSGMIDDICDASRIINSNVEVYLDADR